MNILDKITPSTCCGCGACANLCPTQAIQLIYEDSYWSFFPSINQDCINCSKCLNCCPQLNAKQTNSFTPYGFAVCANDDLLADSSSGGVFGTLCNLILSNGGYVAGAVYDDNWLVKHIVTNDANEAKKIRHSKYVQSNPGNIYQQIKKLLDEQNLVLFTGTPCQIAALKSFLRKEYSNLLTVDIICHGVPSPKIWDKYLSENFNRKSIQNINFRNKKHRNAAPGSITFNVDDKELYSEYFDNSYYKLFLDNFSIRKSCFNCKFAEMPRVGDLSMGDFWGSKTTNTAIDVRKGISIILINSEKGEKIWNDVKPSFAQIESYPVNTLMSWNRNKSYLQRPPRADELIPLITKNNSVRTAYEILSNNRYDVGIFGITMNSNYGGLITYYALYEAVRALGYNPCILFTEFSPRMGISNHSTEFFKSHCNVSVQTPITQFSNFNDIADTFILGSDQVWNYSLFHCWNNSLYFDFIDNSKKKIAYAASFGQEKHTVDAQEIIPVKNCFKNFDYISVREQDGVTILKDQYKVNSNLVLDPVFLVDKELYINLSKQSRLKLSSHGKYVGSYIIEPNKFKLDVIKQISSDLNLKQVNFTDGEMRVFAKKSSVWDTYGLSVEADASIQNWLDMIINSEFVITDSYHATCFCIIFNKPFILLQERWALSRISNINNKFGLGDRWIQDAKIENFKINKTWYDKPYKDVDAIINPHKQESLQWLSTAISAPKRVLPSFNAYPGLNSKTRAEDYFFFLMKKREDYILMVSSCHIDITLFKKIDFKSKLNTMPFNIKDKSGFVLLYDFGNEKIIHRTGEQIDIDYETLYFQITMLVNVGGNRPFNNIYVSDINQSCIRFECNTSSPIVVSVFSKSLKMIVDSFEIVSKNDIISINRNCLKKD